MTAMAEVNAPRPLDLTKALSESKAAIHAPLPHFFSSQRHMEPIEVRVGTGSVAIPAREFHIDRTAFREPLLVGSAKAPAIREMPRSGVVLTHRPDTSPANPVSQAVGAGLMLEELAGAGMTTAGILRKDKRLRTAGILTMTGGALLACNVATPPPETQIAPIILEYQASDGVHPETARMMNVPINTIDTQLSQVDLAKAPHAKDLLTAMHDDIFGSQKEPIPLIINGARVNLTIDNPQDVLADYEHVSDGKNFSFDAVFVKLPVTDPAGKEHFLITMVAPDGSVVTRQAVWDKSEVTEGGITVGTLRELEWQPGDKSANAHLLMAIVNDATKPNQTMWILIDSQDGSRLTLESEEASAVAATPSFSDALVRFGSKPALVSDVSANLPSAVESLPTSVAVTPTAPVETPTTEASPTPAVPKEGDTKIVVENGKDVTYTYKIVTSVDNKETLYSGWFKLVTPTALPTYDWDTYVPDGNGGYKWGKDILPKQIFIEEGVSGAEVIRSFTHVQTPEGTVNNADYMATLSPQIFKRYFGYFPTAKDNPTWQKLQQELQDGKPDTAQLTFTVDGKEYHWSPGPNVGTVVYIIKWDNAAPIEGNGFKEWEEPGLNHFRSTFWGVDAKGNIIGAISSQKSLKELTDLQIREMVLFHDISALYFKDLTNIGYSMPLYDFAASSGAESPPQIQINKNQ